MAICIMMIRNHHSMVGSREFKIQDCINIKDFSDYIFLGKWKNFGQFRKAAGVP